jgi:hypothetical protein
LKISRSFIFTAEYSGQSDEVVIIIDVSEKFAAHLIIFHHFDSEEGGTVSSETLIIFATSKPGGMQNIPCSVFCMASKKTFPYRGFFFNITNTSSDYIF